MDDTHKTGPVCWRTLLFVLAGLLFATEMLRAPSVHQDFVPLYAASVLAAQGRLEDAYATDPEKLKRAGQALTATAHERGYPIRHVSRFLHPPALAGLTIPFTALDFPAAAYLFRTLSLLALAASAFLLLKLAGRDVRDGVGAVVFAGLLLFDPARMTLDLGQTNNFVLMLVLIALSSRSPTGAGLALGLAALFKTFVLAVPGIWMVAGSNDGTRKAAIIAFLSLAAIHSGAYLLWPDGSFMWMDMLSGLSGFQFLWPEQQSMASQVLRAYHGFSASDVINWTHTMSPVAETGHFPQVWAIVIATSAAGLALWQRPDRVSGAVLGLTAGMLASPVMHSHYGLMLAVPAAWVMSRGTPGVGAWLCLAGFGLQVAPLHSDEGAFWIPLTDGLGTHWVFAAYRLAGVALAFAGAVMLIIHGTGKDGRT